jgi:hypothetical protein
MVLLKQISDALAHFPQLYETVPFLQIERFVRFVRRLKYEIQLTQPVTTDLTAPPLRLPLYVHEFLCNVLVLTDDELMQCWSALKAIIWHGNLDRTDDLEDGEAALFQKYATRVNGDKREHIGM